MHRFVSLLPYLVVPVLICRVPLCHSADIHVPGDHAVIQDAVDAAVPGDTVLVADGMWSGPGNVAIDPAGKAITIRSSSGDPLACIIDGMGSAQGFLCISGETSGTMIMGFTLYRCSSGEFSGPVTGAGIVCQNASPTITACRFVDCSAAWTPPGPRPPGSYGQGGGIACIDGAAPMISECEFINCTAAESGGAVFIDSSTPVIQDCVFTGNRTWENGGAVFVRDTIAELIDCDFTDNSARYANGGAICLESSASLIRRCRFTGNIALRGGAVACIDSAPVIGGTIDHANEFETNIAGAGADLFATGAPGVIDATYNTYSTIAESDYSVSPQAAFDLTGSQSSTVPIQNDVYVDPDGSDSNDGLSPGTPFRTIQYAMSRILPSDIRPLTVRLAPGRYSEDTNGEIFPVPLLSHVTISGAGLSLSVLSPDYNCPGMFAYHDVNARVCGLEIRGGSGRTGGGISVEGGDIEISGVSIRESVADTGGGIHLRDTDARITDSRITDNYSRYQGKAVGICNVDGNLMLIDSVIARNQSDSHGAGVYNTGSACLINCRFYDNRTVSFGSGTGVYSRNGPLQMVNCEMAGNFAVSGAAISVTGTFELLNCLITGNHGSNDGAVFTANNATGTIRHTTFAGNTADYPPKSVMDLSDSQLTVADSIFWNDSGTEWTVTDSNLDVTFCAVRGGFAGTGNIDADPVFCPGAFSDHYLCDGLSGGPVSPCIDSGNAQAADCTYSGDWGSLFLDRRTATAGWRADTGPVDMGYHWDHSAYSGVKLDLSKDLLSQGDLLSLTAVVLNNGTTAWNDSRLFVILDVYGNYWFAPSWIGLNDGIDFWSLDIAAGDHLLIPVIPETVWPAVASPAANLMLYGGLTDAAVTGLRGEMDIAVFGYR